MLIPRAQDLFHFGPLHGHDIAVALSGGTAVLLLLEAAKKVFLPSEGPRSTTRERLAGKGVWLSAQSG